MNAAVAEKRARRPVVLVLGDGQVHIPGWVEDLETFRRWARSSDFPERGRFGYFNGQIWVDLSMERLAHNQLKGIIAVVVGGLVMAGRLGVYFHDRMRLTSEAANLSSEPDGMFASEQTLRAKRVLLREGADTLEVEGTPDMVLEVVSPDSVKKDTVVLRELYAQAGIREYWLIDPRHVPQEFSILRHTAKGYTSVRRQGDWLKSAVFGKSFRLTQGTDELRHPVYKLDVR
jgi:Uma2 family endonuclease